MSVQVGAFVANLIKKASHIFMISTRSVTWAFSLSRDNYALESWRKLVQYTPTELVSNPKCVSSTKRLVGKSAGVIRPQRSRVVVSLPALRNGFFLELHKPEIDVVHALDVLRVL